MSDHIFTTGRGDEEHLRGLREPARRAVMAQRHARRWIATATVEPPPACFTFDSGGGGPLFNGTGGTLTNQITGASMYGPNTRNRRSS
jgi:hypothetical protein